MQSSTVNWVFCFVFFFLVSFCQLFGCIWLPWWAAIPSMLFCGAVAIFGLVALSRRVGHLILFYIIGSLLGEIPTISSFGYSIYRLGYTCTYDYYDDNCYQYYDNTQLIINTCFTGATILMWPLMTFFLYKERKHLICTAAVASAAPAAPGAFIAQPIQPAQQPQYQFQYLATTVQQQQQVQTPAAQFGSWQ